jgi:hypothetical protein
MSLPIQELPQHLTTSSIQNVDGLSRSDKRRLNARRSWLAKLAGKQFGLWTVLDKPIPLMTPYIQVYCRCQCGVEQLVNANDIERGASRGCVSCMNRKYLHIPKLPALQLQQRYNALVERCKANKFSSRTYATVENRFQSCQDFVEYMWAEFPTQDYRGLEIDRIDTNGHYERGNIRLVTREQNAQTRRCNTMVSYLGYKMSVAKFARDYVLHYHADAVRAMLLKGMTPQEIVQHAEQRRQTFIVYQGVRYTRAKFFARYCPNYSAAYLFSRLRRAMTNGETLSQALSQFTILSMQELDTVSLITE